MSTLISIQSTDLITNSRADINGNFSALNTDKMETSVLDTDTTLAANSDAKVATQKAVKAYVDANSILTVSSESTAGATHSLTTTASQRVIVWAKGTLNRSTAETAVATVTLAYNGVSKDTVVQLPENSSDARKENFALMYTETPGATTHNVTVTTDIGNLTEVKILVQKFNV